MKRFVTILVAACMALTLSAAVASADEVSSESHAWNGYHWARSANPFTVNLGDNVSADWDSYLNVAARDWDQSSVLNTPIVAGSGSSGCPFVAGRAEVCNGAYGRNGWLGLASIQVLAGGHIYAAKAQMNDSYLGATQGQFKKYNTPAYHQFVVCQEVGHDFGLDHQDENFGNTNLGTCMDYTADPDGGGKYGPSNTHPNAHDYEQLELIYAHLDGGSKHPNVHQVNVTRKSERGELVHKSAAEEVYVRSFKDGTKVITVITLEGQTEAL